MRRLIFNLAFLWVVPGAILPGQVAEEKSDARAGEVVQIGSCDSTVMPTAARAALGYYNRGISRSETGDLDGAVKDYSSALRQDPCLALAYNNRGNALRLKGKLAEAMADFDRAVEINPSLAALNDYSRAISLDPGLHLAHNNRGSLSFALGDSAGAIADFDRAVELRPGYAMAYLNRVLVQLAQGKAREAENDFSWAAGQALWLRKVNSISAP